MVLVLIGGVAIVMPPVLFFEINSVDYESKFDIIKIGISVYK